MIVYPLALPATKSFASLTIRKRNVVGVTTAPYSLKTQTQDHGGQRWEAEFSLPPMLREDGEQWAAFLDELNGPKGTFLAGRPKAKTARGAVRLAPTSLTVNGGGQTGQSLAVQSAQPDTAGLLLRGDLFQMGGGVNARLYSIIQDADLVSGEATLVFWPRLRVSPSDGDALIVQNPVGIWRLVTTAPDFDEDVAGIMRIAGMAIREA